MCHFNSNLELIDFFYMKASFNDIKYNLIQQLFFSTIPTDE